ncbi:ATP-binding protein [Bacteroides sp. AN502]|nr:ATP-binding protein [Caecibacteroides pullorum]
MKILYKILLLFLLLSSSLHAEQIPLDSTLTRLYTRAADLMSEGGQNNYEKAQRTFDSAFAMRGVEQSPIFPILLNEQATLLVYIGEGERAFEMKKKVLPYLPKIKDLEKHISVYNDLAILYRRRHMNDSTLYYYNKALEAALQYKDEGWITHIYNNVSVFYFNIRQLHEAEKYIDLSAEHAVKTDDPFSTFSAWQLRAAIKAELDKLDDAEQSIRKAWEIACQSGGNASSWKIRCLPSLLRVLERREQPDSVEHYLQIGNRLLEEEPDNSIAAIGFIQVRASTEMNRKNYTQALKDMLWLRKRNTGSEPKTLLTQIAQCYHATGNQAQAYAYMDSARMWTDTLAQQNLTRQMAEFNVKYQTQEKELQIANLKQQQLEHQALLLKGAIGSGLLLICISIILLGVYHKKRTAEQKIELLKQENDLNSARRYIEGLETECKYFAKELHDGIANDLLALQMKMSNQTSKNNAEELTNLVGQIRNSVRNISHELMPPEFDELSLDEILVRYASNLKANTGIQTSYTPTIGNASRNLPNETAYELYRITQELTMNIAKHTQADYIHISLQTENGTRYILQIADNGIQSANQQSTKNDGIGLRTINDRIKAIRATTNQTQSSDGNNIFTLQFDI